jgi:hypothetical protein
MHGKGGTVTQAERDAKAYRIAKEFLFGLNVAGVTSDLVEKYLNPSETLSRAQSIPGIYSRILESAQNAGMKSGVIGKSIGGVDNLGPVLCGFDPTAVLAKFGAEWEKVLDEIEATLKPRGKVRREPRSIWPHYCRTILSAARFMQQFSTPDDFYRWVEFFDHDERARVALPMLLDREIDGLGFALACDFLKELGFVNFAKPDVHLRDIFCGLGLCPSNADDYDVFKAVVRVAMHAKVTPYNADKLFWLIGSGYFYNDPQIGDDGRIGNNKKDFIEFAIARLG